LAPGTRERAETLSELVSRHRLFEAARRSAGWTIDELWIDYLALGGTLPAFDVDAYLAGLMPIPPGQQDVLACALNERLTDLSEKVRLPYLTVLPDRCEAALNELAQEGHRGRSHHHEQGLVPPPAVEQRPEERTGQPPVTEHRRSDAASATREGTRP
jgi:hypothetical protein